MDPGRARVSVRGPAIVTGIGGGSQHPSASSPSIHPYGRPWYSKKYFGATSGRWAETDPKQIPRDGCGFLGIPNDFRKSHTDFMRTYHQLDTAGGPHSMDEKPPKEKDRYRRTVILPRAEDERLALPGGFRDFRARDASASPGPDGAARLMSQTMTPVRNRFSRTRSDSGFLQREKTDAQDQPPSRDTTPLGARQQTFAQFRDPLQRDEAMAARETETSYLKLWYGDRSCLKSCSDKTAGVPTAGFRRAFATHNSLPRIGAF